MKFKKIVGFGDSWIWGDELLDPALRNHPRASPVLIENTFYRQENSFVGKLAHYYQVPYENFGIPGGSLQSTIWTYLWWLENEQLDPSECLVLVGLTGASRTSFYNPNHVVYSNDPPWNRFVHSAWVHSGFEGSGADWTQMIKSHMTLTDCRELEKLNYRQTVLFFEGQYACNHNILQLCTIPPPSLMRSKNLVWPDHGLNYLVKDKKYLCAGGHPNEAGHIVIRDHLIPEIERVILA
jgi:hypothetical protein